MEKKILEYERFIEKEASNKKLSEKEREKLFAYHAEMLRNFQMERLIHLKVMFFFLGVTLILLAGTMTIAMTGVILGTEMMILLGILDLIMVVLSIAYVRHYYFLENHVQGLYKWFDKIGEKNIE